MHKKTIFRFIVFLSLIFFGLFSIFPLSISCAQNSLSDTPEVIQIKVENDLLSVNLENAQMKTVLQEIARQTGLQFEGLENAEGRVTHQFENVPLDEGLRKISQSFIMIFKKSGEKGDALRVQKVIIIAQNGMSEADSAELNSEEKIPAEKIVVEPAPAEKRAGEKKESLASLSQPAAPLVPQVNNTKSEKLIRSVPRTYPPVQSEEEKENKIKTTPRVRSSEKSSSRAVIEARTKEKAKEKEQPVASRPRVPTKERPEKEKPQKQATSSSLKPAAPKEPPAVAKAIPSPSSASSDVALGEKYFKEKRWDKAITYFKKYLEKNPSDSEMQERLDTAQRKSDQAISFYKEAQKLEKEKELEEAYKYYKKSYDLYPLLYDTWEKMRALKRKMKK